MATGINGYNPISYAYNIDPTTPVYDENSNDTFGYGVSPVPYSRMWNPIAFMDEAPKNKNITQQFLVMFMLRSLLLKTLFSAQILVLIIGISVEECLHQSFSFCRM